MKKCWSGLSSESRPTKPRITPKEVSNGSGSLGARGAEGGQEPITSIKV